LRGAYLGGADLRGANLGGAKLGGANLGDQWIIQGPCTQDGYWTFLQKLTDDKEPMIKAGCRYKTIPGALAHWAATRKGTVLGRERLAIVKFLEWTAMTRGLIPGGEANA
jgi:uncharacterized protein YjbI with pentapeptide repeats